MYHQEYFRMTSLHFSESLFLSQCSTLLWNQSYEISQSDGDKDDTKALSPYFIISEPALTRTTNGEVPSKAHDNQ